MPRFASSEDLSAHMRRIRSKDTKPELKVRRLIHSMGIRYRLHRADLPGTPDLVFSSRKKVVFVYGCFWHQHDCALGRKQPATNRDYWLPKLARNCERDEQAKQRLALQNWQVLVVWECETKDLESLKERIARFLKARA